MPLPVPLPQIATPEIIQAHGDRVACTGGGGALGHPRVFLTFDPEHKAVCPYCSRVYRQVQQAGESGHH
jgi:uncharacterized Zn-finger protein